METKLQRDVRFLKAYSLIITLLLAVVAFTTMTRADQKPKFEEIDVERINVVEKDGKVKLVISNKDRFPDPVIKGRAIRYGKAGRPAA